MSYCRLSDYSDVYLYPDVDGGVMCCFCRLNDAERIRLWTLEDTLAHIHAHREAGHKVPTGVEEDVRQDSEAGRIEWGEPD